LVARAGFTQTNKHVWNIWQVTVAALVLASPFSGISKSWDRPLENWILTFRPALFPTDGQTSGWVPPLLIPSHHGLKTTLGDNRNCFFPACIQSSLFRSVGPRTGSVPCRDPATSLHRCGRPGFQCTRCRLGVGTFYLTLFLSNEQGCLWFRWFSCVDRIPL